MMASTSVVERNEGMKRGEWGFGTARIKRTTKIGMIIYNVTTTTENKCDDCVRTAPLDLSVDVLQDVLLLVTATDNKVDILETEHGVFHAGAGSAASRAGARDVRPVLEVLVVVVVGGHDEFCWVLLCFVLYWFCWFCWSFSNACSLVAPFKFCSS